MLRSLSITAALAAIVLAPALAAAPAHGKRSTRHWHGYGFLPGYPPIHLDNRGQGYWYGGPGFYRGRWNYGGFGPCWTKTPIGPIWNCG